MKKLLTLALALVLLPGLAACGNGGKQPDPTTGEITSITPTDAPGATSSDTTTLPPPREAPLWAKEFYETHKGAMLELADILLALEMKPVDAQAYNMTPPWPPIDVEMQMLDFTVYLSNTTFSYPHYTDRAGNEVSFNEQQEKKILDYYTAALEETKRSPGIDARIENGKRAVSFGLDGYEEVSVYMIYMPDGHLLLSYPDPETNERIHASEAVLDKNWYIYTF
jgi:hypothetical protein